MTWNASAMLTSAISDPMCRVRILDEAERPAARRVELSIAWKNAAGQMMRPVALTVWKYPDGEAP
jgi:hypothetical protein